jgi:hypothetical protein
MEYKLQRLHARFLEAVEGKEAAFSLTVSLDPLDVGLVTGGIKSGPTTWLPAGRDESGTFELPRSSLVSFLLNSISEG